NDINRAVYKAPANEVVNLALGFEVLLNKSQQDVLNPEGINCFRFFEGRGFRLWGARTISSDPEWKYVNLRRYFAYLERSIDRGNGRLVCLIGIAPLRPAEFVIFRIGQWTADRKG